MGDECRVFRRLRRRKSVTLEGGTDNGTSLVCDAASGETRGSGFQPDVGRDGRPPSQAAHPLTAVAASSFTRPSDQLKAKVLSPLTNDRSGSPTAARRQPVSSLEAPGASPGVPVFSR